MVIVLEIHGKLKNRKEILLRTDNIDNGIMDNYLLLKSKLAEKPLLFAAFTQYLSAFLQVCLHKQSITIKKYVYGNDNSN